MRILKKSQCRKFLNIPFVAKYQKNSRGGPFGDIKKFSKSLKAEKKSNKGIRLVSSDFVGYVKKVNEREDTLH